MFCNIDKIFLEARKNNISFLNLLIRGYKRVNLLISVYALKILALRRYRRTSTRQRVDNKGIKVKNFVGFTMDNLGDVLRSTPAIRALKMRYPKSKLTMVINNYNYSVLKNSPHINQFIIIPKQPGLIYTFLLLQKLNKYRFSHAFILSFGPLFATYANLLFYILRIPDRLGWVHLNYNFLLTQQVKSIKHDSHVQNMLDVVRLIGCDSQDFSKEMFLKTSEEKAPEIIFEKYGILEQDLVVLISPGGYGHIGYTVSRLWSIDRYKKLCDFLIKNYHAKIIISGIKQELSLLKSLQSGFGNRVFNLGGKISIRQLAAILKKVDLVITNDNGTVHIADAVKAKKVVAILGPTDPNVIIESGNKNIIVISKKLSCGPCNTIEGSKECIYQNGQKCLTDLSVKDVIKTLKPIVDRIFKQKRKNVR